MVAYRKATIGLADEVVHLEDGGGRPGHTRSLLERSPSYSRLVNAYEHIDHTEPGGGALMSADHRAHVGNPDGHRGGACARSRPSAACATRRVREGIGGTLVLAVLASAGQVAVPIAVQQTLDRGLGNPGGPDVRFTIPMGLLAGVAILVTAWAAYAMTKRLFTTSERGLATLRIKAFRHVHDLPLLTQNTERRGALVARVTSDVTRSASSWCSRVFFVVSVGSRCWSPP